MPDELNIQLDGVGADGGAAHVVRAGLDAYNQRFVPLPGQQPLNLFVRGPDGAVLGGLLGGTYWAWLYIEIFWLSEDLRGRGLGSKLLAAAEAEALRRGCRHVHLDTIDFQALPFYQKHGYTLFGVLDDKPPGHQSYYLRKDLA
jgi:GNAT superfamily N-acetyltransferase